MPQLLSGGFAQPAIDAAHVFRDVLQAMARPGRITRITGVSPPPGLSPAAASVLLTLADETTPVYLAGACDSAPIRNYLRFHTGAPISDRKDAAFALGDWEALAPLSDYPLGSDGYPDRSATLIFELPALTAMGARLTGPWHPHACAAVATGDRCVYRQCAAFSTRAGFHLHQRRCDRGAAAYDTCGDGLNVCGGERRRARHRGGA